MPKTPIQELAEFGQSAWLDYISRELLEGGRLKQFIAQGLRGMTSNPSIFNQSIANSKDYDQRIQELREAGKTAFEIYDELTVKDIQDACDHFLSVYQSTNKLDGYVSLEINPKLARQVNEQIAEGKRLYQKVARPNVMIKVPSTKEGLPVVEELIASGINVNVTLIFSQDQYIKTAQAFIKGLQRASAKGIDITQIHSVASVFVSRVDTQIDKELGEKIAADQSELRKAKMMALLGRAAQSNCRIIFEKFKEIFSGPEFMALQKKGANVQRVLWASTSTKNPQYKDIKYVTELITKPTVNTLPEPTLKAFLDHGKVADGFGDFENIEAVNVIESLEYFQIKIDQVCKQLLDDGVVAFEKSFESLMEAIEKKAEILAKVK